MFTRFLRGYRNYRKAITTVKSVEFHFCGNAKPDSGFLAAQEEVDEIKTERWLAGGYQRATATSAQSASHPRCPF
jgi:hypothetical protein